MTQPAFDTDEQLSGRAADAVADMHSELSRRYSGLNTAEAQLAEALLTAHATSAAGRQRLQNIQHQVIEAIVNPVNALDTPAGERQFLLFLRTKIAEIQSVVDDGALTASDQAELTRALANGYLVDPPPAAAPVTAPVQQPAMSAPGAGMGSLPSALGGLPQAAPAMPPGAKGLGAATPPLGWLSSLLDGQGADGQGLDGHDDTGGERDSADEGPHDSDDPADADAADARDDAPPDEDGPAETRPDAS